MDLLISSWGLLVTAYAVFLVVKGTAVESERDAMASYIETLEEELDTYQPPSRSRTPKEKREIGYV
jgi:hypothetical protein